MFNIFKKKKNLQNREILEASNSNTKEKSNKTFFNKALSKTFDNIKLIVPQKKEKIEFDTIEELLIQADVEYEVIEKMMSGLSKMITRRELKERLLSLFKDNNSLSDIEQKPFVELIFGINGAGKTTTIAKLAYKYKQHKKSVILGAADTFRAAAIEQLTSWAKKIEVPIIKTKQGHDPSAVSYDTISSAIARKIDHVIIDTAGRLQTQTNLNNELKKIVKICQKACNGAPHRKIMILDGTQGNSAIAQAKAFHDIIGIDGIIITKLDGTSKGGALFSISNQLQIPILYIGIGEKEEDLVTFHPEDFVNSLLDGIYTNEKKEISKE